MVATFVALGAIVLCVTGAEALYADMGHSASRPDPQSMVFLCDAVPAAQLLRAGGALMLNDPMGDGQVFFELVPQD